MTGEERKAQILDTAITMFGRHGFKGATTRALAEAAGVSEATIFKHFPTKSDLYGAAFERRARVGTDQIIAELQGYMDDGDDERLVRRIVEAMFQGFELDRDMQRMLLYAQLEQDAAANNRLWAQIQQYRLFGFLADFVARRQREGRFGPGEPMILVMALVGLPVHTAIRAKLYGIETGFTDEQTIDTLAGFLLGGLRAGAPSD